MRGEKRKRIQQNPPLYLAIGFLFVILTGAGLLTLPISHTNNQFAPFIDALFTATSATCVTGLTVFNISTDFTLFGQTVLLTLIQIGGLGFMAMTILIAVVLNRKITLSDRLIIKEQFGQDNLRGMVRWMRYVVIFSLGVELVGALILSTQWVPQFGFRRGIWYSVFHSISAFCNAGFDLFGDSMVQFRTNPIILLPIAFLIIIGGLGFGVYLDFFTHKRQKSLHTKLVIGMTAILLIGGMIGFFLLEDANANTIAQQSVSTQWLNAFFQSATTRTAGFFSFGQAQMLEMSVILTVLLMLIGGSPAGTAGGMKTTTVAVLLLSTYSQLRGKEDVEIFHRTISKETVLRATTIIILSLFWVMTVSLIITIVENIAFLQALFETVSAFATVGLTMDLTTHLTSLSKILLILSMYIGRVGPVTIAYALFKTKKRKETTSANGKVMVG